MRISFTQHAIDRYIKRFARGSSHAEARADLQRMEPTPVKQKTIRGQQLWRVEDPTLYFVTKPDGKEHVCVTILSPEMVEDEHGLESEEKEMLEAYDRLRGSLVLGTYSREDYRQVAERADKVVGNAKNKLQEIKDEKEALIKILDREDKTEIHNLQQKISSLELKLKKHVERDVEREENAKNLRKALSAAVRGLMRSQGATVAVEHALAQIGEMDVNFVKKEFWDK